MGKQPIYFTKKQIHIGMMEVLYEKVTWIGRNSKSDSVLFCMIAVIPNRQTHTQHDPPVDPRSPSIQATCFLLYEGEEDSMRCNQGLTIEDQFKLSSLCSFIILW